MHAGVVSAPFLLPLDEEDALPFGMKVPYTRYWGPASNTRD